MAIRLQNSKANVHAAFALEENRIALRTTILYDICSQWRSQEKIKVPPCRAEDATRLGGSGGILPRENFET